MHLTSKQASAFLLAFCLGLGFIIAASCSKEPGDGGSSKITGKVYIREYNPNFTFLIAEYWAADMDVYIIYGDGVTSNDRLRTGPDGDFEFPYLRPGKYRIYVYSADSTMTSPSGNIAVYRDAEITKNKQSVDAGTIVVLKN
jgi:hypothetical protein